MNTIFSDLQQQNTLALQNYHNHRQPFRYFRDHTQAIDCALCHLWTNYFANSELALLAIGGLGRQELYPYSDLDLLIISPTDLSPEEHMHIAQFVQVLWDNKLSPAVQSGSLQQISHLMQHDLNLNTALLEARFLSGNLALAQKALNTFTQQRDTVSFMQSKCLEMQQRHTKQPALSLEPNIKNGAGGLRDIHTIIWLAKAQGSLESFIKHPIITRTEAALLRSSHRYLAQIRIDLHLAAGREEDRLAFDWQTTLAQQHGGGIESLMHKVYRTVKTVLQLNGILIPMLNDRVVSAFPRVVHHLDNDYYQINNQIAVRDISLFRRQPEHLFIILQRWQDNVSITDIAPRTLRAWWAASRYINHAFYQNPDNRRRFIHFFQRGTGLTHLLRFLNLYGVLGRYLPAWDNIVGLLQHDLFHAYPVDDHILMVLRNMRRLTMEAHSHELPAAATLMQHFRQPEILYLAAFFHDIAKGRGGKHELEGVTDATQFAHDHFLSSHETELLSWLVEHHLLMSRVSQKEDINDPNIVQKFCQQVENTEKLTALYLLTICDIRGTNPKIWNAWKAQLLENLFQAAFAQLSGSLKPETDIASRKRRVHDYLHQNGFNNQSIRRLQTALGEAYFSRHSTPTSLWQLPKIAANPEQAIAYVDNVSDALSLTVLVYMPNRDRLFTRICRLFSQYGLDIVAARAFVTAHDFILDNFVVNLPEHCDHARRTQIAKNIQHDLQHFATGGQLQFTPNNTKPSRQARLTPIAPRIIIERSENGQHTIEIIAANRPYLLADITEVFAHHHVRLYYAKIATFAERVEDSFIVFCPDLDKADKEWIIKRDLFSTLS